MFCYSNEINRSRSINYALFNRWARSLLLKLVFKSSFDELNSELKRSSLLFSVTIVSLSFDSDSFVLKKKELNTSSLEEKLWTEEESDSEENDVERETSFRFYSR